MKKAALNVSTVQSNKDRVGSYVWFIFFLLPNEGYGLTWRGTNSANELCRKFHNKVA